jgi:hypothetical protein
MGGYGSSRWGSYMKKEIVENCRTLSIFELRHDGLLGPRSWQEGVLIWPKVNSREDQDRIGFVLDTQSDMPTMRLIYEVGRWDKEPVDLVVQLQTTPCFFGGQRWWFTCPLTKNGQPCERRVAKLYLPPGGRYFGCRDCHELVYQSSQEGNQSDSPYYLDMEILRA